LKIDDDLAGKRGRITGVYQKGLCAERDYKESREEQDKERSLQGKTTRGNEVLPPHNRMEGSSKARDYAAIKQQEFQQAEKDMRSQGGTTLRQRGRGGGINETRQEGETLIS